MLIKAVADFELEGISKVALEIKCGEYLSVDDPIAESAINQGVAVPATLEEARADCPAYWKRMAASSKVETAAPSTPAAVAAPQPLWMPDVAAAASDEPHTKPKNKKAHS